MLKQHFERLSNTEQQRLKIALIVVLFLVAYLLIWQPVAQKNDKFKATLEQKAQLLSWMQDSAAKVKSAGSSAHRVKSATSIQQLISREAGRYKLSISRLHTTASAKVQLQLEQANFNTLLEFIGHLSIQGAALEQLAINRLDNTGNVSVRLTFGVGQ